MNSLDGESEVSYPVKIYHANPGDPVVNVVLKITHRNVLGMPDRFELVDHDQPTDVSTGDSEFVIVVGPASLFDNREIGQDNGKGDNS